MSDKCVYHHDYDVSFGYHIVADNIDLYCTISDLLVNDFGIEHYVIQVENDKKYRNVNFNCIYI